MTPTDPRVRRTWRLFLLFNLIALPALFFLAREVVQRRELSAQKPLPVYGTLRPFQLTDRGGNSFGLRDMKQRIWVANFMFTSCPNECPAMNFKMSLLQDSLSKDASFISFSVDPGHDTPEVLAGYAKKFKAKEGVWFFLTGAKSAVGQILEDCHFAKAEDPLLHGLRLVLMDGEGRIRGYYEDRKSVV